MKKNLLIVFAKNIVLGKVKTRLAKTIGNTGAFNVYKRLFDITEKESSSVKNATIRVYFSDVIINSKWVNQEKFVQKGDSLGDRMKDAFAKGLADGYSNIIGVGADLPDLNSALIENAFTKLQKHDFVFGPAEDGGYYLVGTTLPNGLYIFENKPWSTPNLLKITTQEIKEKGNTVTLLNPLNDIDTIEDLENSILANEFKDLIKKGKSTNLSSI